VLHLAAEVCANDDSLFLHLAQSLDQHLLGCLRNQSAKLTQSNWSLHEQQEDFELPFSPKQIQSQMCARLLVRPLPVRISEWRSRDDAETRAHGARPPGQRSGIPAINSNRGDPNSC
jgi:hypothetical protein